ncbi:MAG: c-type cytochrome [Planctomycetota bacterium]|nr:c-type cytochrome [Planctomycetota bacterium]
MRFHRSLLLGWALIVTLLTAAGFQRVTEAAAVAMERGAKVTFSTVRGDKVTHSQRARLLSLAVERGETPTPYLPAGAFRAQFDAVVTLPARDRMKFRVDGRGKIKLSVNGKEVLAGRMRGREPLESAKAVRLKKGENDLCVEFESGARGDGELRLFWSGYDFGFEPIAPELLSYDAADEDVRRGEQLRRGHALFVERRCARCHDYDQLRVSESAYLELDRAGPDMRRVASRAKAGWLAKWMRDPHAVRADATMPKMPLSDRDADDVAVYLAQLGAAPAAVTFTEAQRTAGAVRFRELGCVACHPRTDETEEDAAIGGRIPLGFAAEKWHGAALIAYLQEPSAHYPDVRMPNLKVSEGDASDLAAYLLAAQVDLPAPKGDAKKGRRLVQKSGCVLCHAFGDDVPPADRVFPRYRNLKPERGCLADKPDGSAPEFHFDDEERAALRAFLPFGGDAPFRSAPMDYIARHMTADRCVACHAVDGDQSTWAQLAERWSADEPLPPEQDPGAQGVPALTWVGSKLQPSWIRDFVTGKLPSPRPWMTARMPKFERHGAALTDGLVREHGYGAKDEPILAGKANLAMHGQRLLAQGSGFGCVQCHAVGDNKATQVFEREGINLLTARGRLRHEYYTRWLADPTRLDPDARMPKYADDKGKTAFTDVLGGKAADQFEAIWQFLGDRARK